MDTDNHQDYHDDINDQVSLPGFRFHPTDEELIGFYLRRKIEKKSISIELIKEIDIYKYDPWDLPKFSSIAGEKEYYFFCRRGRKYKNSIRPNRVTGSGFWKATGIDKPVYSNEGAGQDCIGLKKTLVYYHGIAGKGTKTDWMMHEFRLPSTDIHSHLIKNNKTTTANIHLQEAEILTLCRIFKRNVSNRTNLPVWKPLSAQCSNGKSSKICCSTVDSNCEEAYISFENGGQPEFNPPLTMSQHHSAACSVSGICMNQNASDFFTYNSWGELGSVMEFADDRFQFPGYF